ncbi:hypothetical protein HG537_0H01430 [Torulaspora globosa]|uniref:Methyltransferase small domain-containing protein n=1 Tax=Torulaspora globosa TaxID=48254 RepID=A0A7H9HY85_9SACH|nr:hypothetical protein HG537_0H01430 [Torulaspora sp. CBS 2947]
MDRVDRIELGSSMLPTPYVNCDYETVYEPCEDSFLLLDCLEDQQEYLGSRFQDALSVVCELGPGTGVVTTFMMQNGIPTSGKSVYFGVDISPWALEATRDTVRRNKCDGIFMETVQCDLTSCLKPGEVDLLVFNPPYVPAENVPEIPDDAVDRSRWLDLALLGGENGMAVTERLLQQLDTVLSRNGVAYILFCARNHPEEVAERMRNEYGWEVELVIHRKAGWEVLSVYRFSRKIM